MLSWLVEGEGQRSGLGATYVCFSLEHENPQFLGLQSLSLLAEIQEQHLPVVATQYLQVGTSLLHDLVPRHIKEGPARSIYPPEGATKILA